MLSAPRYLLGVLEILWLGGFAWLGASVLRRALLANAGGAPAILATLVLALALLIWTAELLGTFGAFEAVAYLAVTAALAIAIWALRRRLARDRGGGQRARPQRPPQPPSRARGRFPIPTLVAVLFAALAVAHFAIGVRTRLDTGMTGFDSTWYHAPFAAGFFQSGDTWSLHFIAPQFLAWFYPANAELFHAVGMLAFDRDLLSPFLNLGWFAACLLACWCIGRPYRVAPWSLVAGAVALSLPALADQAGEARSDLAAIFFLLAAVALALGFWKERPRDRGGLAAGSLVLAGLCAGLAAGTKLNFLLPAAALVVGLAAVSPLGGRLRALAILFLSALAGGGYWYLRNLAHTGNPLPWFGHLGPISLPAPSQALGGRQAHSVLSYLGDGSVWSGWFLPGLDHGLTLLWPLLALAAAAGLLLCLVSGAGALRVAGAAGLLAALAWLIAPTSASGPAGIPAGFESGLRYLTPALILGLALLPAAPLCRRRLSRLASAGGGLGSRRSGAATALASRPLRVALALLGVAVVTAIGYPVQRHYLKARYSDPSFTTPGLNAAFRWARSISDSRIATTSTRQYPLFGTDLSNRVQFVGEERPHGGFLAPTTCRRWRRLLDQGRYQYVVASRDRIEPGEPAYPSTARWTEGPWAEVVLRKAPTVVFKLTAPPPVSSCGAKRTG